MAARPGPTRHQPADAHLPARDRRRRGHRRRGHARPDLPALDGDYLFADFYDGDLMTFAPDLANNEADSARRHRRPDVPKPVDLQRSGAGGQVYVSSLARQVYRLEPLP